jgi:succinyl-CoA synthetase beta subunit
MLKLIFDNALYRQKAYEMRDILEENPIEVEAKEVGLNYVDLDGTVGCMERCWISNGNYGFNSAGFEPANFLT